MSEVIMLGTGRALPTATQENTYFALSGEHGFVLVDCAGAPYRRLLKAKLDPARLSAFIVTHFHPDHAYGVPSLLISLWLAGRKAPLELYAPADALARVQIMMQLYDPDSWPGMFPIEYRGIAATAGAPVLANADFAITATSGRHFIPTVGLHAADREPAQCLSTPPTLSRARKSPTWRVMPTYSSTRRRGQVRGIHLRNKRRSSRTTPV